MLRKVTSCTPLEEPLPLELSPPPPQATSSVLASPATRTVRQGRPRPGLRADPVLRADEDGVEPDIWRSPQGAGGWTGRSVRTAPRLVRCSDRAGTRRRVLRSADPRVLWSCGGAP